MWDAKAPSLLKRHLYMVHTSNKGFLQVPNDLGDTKSKLQRFMAQVIVLIIINAMISNDWKIGIMEKSKKRQKNREILKGTGVNVSLIIIQWKPYATNNNKERTS